MGVVEGTPHWVIYQSRVLGPYLVFLINKTFIANSVAAYVIFLMLGLVLSGLLFLKTLSLDFEGSPKYLGFLIFQILFSFSLNNLWLYPWDILSLLLSVVFLYLVVSNAGVKFYVLLFFISIFNRENGLLIALFLCTRAAITFLVAKYGLTKTSTVVFDWKQFFLGVGLLIFGVLITYVLRTYLLVKEIGPEIFIDSDGLGGKFLYPFVQYNSGYFANALMLRDGGVSMVIPVLYCCCVYLVFRMCFVKEGRFLPYSLINLSALIAIFVFGRVSETRVFFELIPFFAYSSILMLQESRFFTSNA